METEQPSSNSQSLLPFAQYITSSNVRISQLMLRPEIENQVRQEMYRFVKFCNTHRQQCHELLNLAFLTSEFESQQDKVISSKCNQILTSSSPNIIEIFIKAKQSQETKKDNQMIDDDVVNGMQQEQKAQELQRKYENLTYLFEFLDRPKQTINTSCVGQIIKVLQNLIQNQISDLYEYFKFNQKSLDRLIQLSCYFAGISEFLGKMIGQETNENAYRDMKQTIIQKLIKKIKDIQKLATDQYIFILDFVEALFNRSKFRSQQVQQIVYITQRLVEDDIVSFFTKKLYSICKQAYTPTNQLILKNCLQYLLLLCARIESDDEADMYSYDESQKSKLQEPTMQFHLKSIQQLYNWFFLVCPSSEYSNSTRLSYFQFVLKISNNRYFKQKTFDNTMPIINLMKIFKNERQNGLVRGYLIQLIELALNRRNQISSSEALKIVSSLGPIENFLKVQQCRAFVEKIIILLNSKNQSFGNHYKGMNIQYSIDKFVEIVGKELNFVQNRKGRAKQLLFLERYEKQSLKSESEQYANMDQNSEIQDNFQLQLPKKISKNKDAVEENQAILDNSQEQNSQKVQ